MGEFVGVIVGVDVTAVSSALFSPVDRTPPPHPQHALGWRREEEMDKKPWLVNDTRR